MDAAHTYFNKIVLFLATALLLVVPGRAQTFNLQGTGTSAITGVSLSGQAVGVSVYASDNNTAITFGTSTVYDNAPNPSHGWLGISTGNNGFTTPTTLLFSVVNTGAMVTGTTYTATVTLTSTSPAGITGTIGVQYVYGTSSGGGGSLTASTNSVSLSGASGVATSTQVQLTNNTGGTITFNNPGVTTNTGGNWLSASVVTNTVLSGQFTYVTIAVPNGLSLANSQYSGAVVITPNGGGASTQINVTYTVGSGGGSGNLIASPNPITWNYNSGTTAYPSSQLVTLSSSTGASSYVAIVSSSSPWLYVNGVSSTSGYISSGITISANTTAMSALTSTPSAGYVTVTDSNNNVVTITVNLTVNGASNSGITWQPNPVTIGAAVGVVSQQQTITLSSSTSGTFSITSISGTGLTVGGVTTGSTIPALAYVTVYGNPTNLGSSTYQGYLYVALTPSGGGSPIYQTVPISFVVGSGGGGTTTVAGVTPTLLTFAYQTNSSSQPYAQRIFVTGNGTFSVSTPTDPAGHAVPWLTLNPASIGAAPASILVTVNPAGLVANATPYSASLQVTPYVGASPVSVSINLLVTGSPVVAANPASLYFAYNVGDSLPSSPVYLYASDNSAMAVTASTSTSWLTVTTPYPPNTGTSFTVQANPGSLANGVYTGSVTVTAAGAANSPVSLTVVLTVSGSSSTGGGNLTLGSLTSFTWTQGSSTYPASQSLSVSAATSTYYTASASSTGNWLSISGFSGGYTSSYPTLTVSVIQSVLAGLSAGSYPGTITLTANNVQQTVNAVLVVSSSGTGGGSGNVTVTANSTTGTPSLSFTSVAGSAPASQTLQVVSASGSAPVAFTISSSATWLSTGVSSNTSLNTPVTNPGLTIGIVTPITLTPSSTPYTATITVTPNGTGTNGIVAVTVPVSFTVTAAPTISVTSPTILTFQYQAGGVSPSTQTITVSGGGAAIAFSAAVTSGTWLSVTPISGTTPTTGTASLTVAATPGTLGAGSYPGSIVVSGTGGAGGSITINATLVVTAPLPTINSVVNAASFLAGSVSPGEIVTLFGTAMGPATAAYATVDPTTGKLATTIGGVQVLFNGIPAPMIYASAAQISVIVPYEMAPISSPAVWVKFSNQTSNAYQLTSATTMPGIFTQNAQGSGPGAILNQDFSLNGPGNGAAKGSIVMVYMTGEGQTSPAGVTGKITVANLPPPQVTPSPLLTSIGVLINGQPANWTYAGEAPGLAAGLLQLNVQIPTNAQSGNLSITVSIGSNVSQNGVTVTVR